MAAVVDVETTGLDCSVDEIIEIGVVLFTFNGGTGEVLGPVDSYAGLREPKVGIHPRAQAKHGLSLEALKGQRLDEERIRDLLERAEFIVAHNAPFDRRFVSRAFPKLPAKPWVCSISSVDWCAFGAPSSKLDDLRDYFQIRGGPRHRAVSDAHATLDLLSIRDGAGFPIFRCLVEGSSAAPPLVPEAGVVQAPRKKLPLRYREPGATVIESAGATIIGGDESKRPSAGALRELMALLSVIIADGVIDDEEVRSLDAWMMGNVSLSREFPFNVLATQLSRVLGNGCPNMRELSHLMDLARQILHPASLGTIDLRTVEDTPLTQPPPAVLFPAQTFVFTGEFLFGEKSECERVTTDLGGIRKAGVTKATDYVVAGALGSGEWIHGCYGTKIQKAIENIRGGSTTSIISEAHWFAAVSAELALANARR